MATAGTSPAYQSIADAARPVGAHPATLTRWILRGVRDPRNGGRIKLEAIRTPGRWLVPEGAVNRFLAEVTAARTGEPAAAAVAAQKAARDQELARVRAELDALGI